jgi:hypothetical protein
MTVQYQIRSPRNTILHIFEDGSVPGSAEINARNRLDKCHNARLLRVTTTEEDITNGEDPISSYCYDPRPVVIGLSAGNLESDKAKYFGISKSAVMRTIADELGTHVIDIPLAN